MRRLCPASPYGDVVFPKPCGGTAQSFSQGSHADSAIEFAGGNFYLTGVGDLPPP
jgi:hypothetical protein